MLNDNIYVVLLLFVNYQNLAFNLYYAKCIDLISYATDKNNNNNNNFIYLISS